MWDFLTHLKCSLDTSEDQVKASTCQSWIYYISLVLLSPLQPRKKPHIFRIYLTAIFTEDNTEENVWDDFTCSMNQHSALMEKKPSEAFEKSRNFQYFLLFTNKCICTCICTYINVCLSLFIQYIYICQYMTFCNISSAYLTPYIFEVSWKQEYSNIPQQREIYLRVISSGAWNLSASADILFKSKTYLKTCLDVMAFN